MEREMLDVVVKTHGGEVELFQADGEPGTIRLAREQIGILIEWLTVAEGELDAAAEAGWARRDWCLAISSRPESRTRPHGGRRASQDPPTRRGEVELLAGRASKDQA